MLPPRFEDASLLLGGEAGEAGKLAGTGAVADVSGSDGRSGFGGCSDRYSNSLLNFFLWINFILTLFTSAGVMTEI